jgi:hypothetical protein
MTMRKTAASAPHRRRLATRRWRSLVLLPVLLGVAAVAAAVVAANAPPTISSDQADYAPGSTVTLSGTNWQAGEAVDIFVDDNDGLSWSHASDPDPVADAAGSLGYQFVLPPYFVSGYTVTATGALSGTATTTFTDLAIGTYDQCSNDDGDGYATGDTGCRWINGNLQSNNSTYFEGDATVQRLWLKDFIPGSSHSVTFKYGTTKSGTHAYDFLTTYDYSEGWISLADLCQDIDGCTTAAVDTQVMGDDPNVPPAIEDAPQLFTMRGGDLTGATNPQIVSGSYAGDSETAVTVTFTVAASGSMCATKGQDTTCAVAIFFGAHIAESAEWIAVDGAGGATNIPGSPYHVSLDAVDGSSAGERDNQMQAGALGGTIVIVKDADPNDPQDFNFTLTDQSGFALDDDADGTLPNSRSFDVPAGDYDAVELAPPAGWKLTNLVCVDPTTNTTVNIATRTAEIDLASGETVTCTFTNTLARGNIVVVKQTNPDGSAQLFTFDTSYGPDFSLSDGQSNDSGALLPGSYSVAEIVPAGWDLTSATCDDGSAPANIGLGAGETVTCTFTNTQRGRIIVVKQTIPDGSAQLFTFDTSYGPDFSLSDGQSNDSGTLAPGTYSVAEIVPSGWDLTSATCDDGSAPASIGLGAGETVRCTFTNTQRATIRIIKDTIPNGPQDFGFTATESTDTPIPDFALDDDADPTLPNSRDFSDLKPGDYTVTETTVAGWDLTGMGCASTNGNSSVNVSLATATATISLGAGDLVTCSFRNTERGHIIVDKVTIPAGDPQSFDFDASGGSSPAYTDFSLTDAATPNDQALRPGNYSVSETVPAGWDLESATCTSSIGDTETPAAIELDAGETVRCTFTNEKDGHVSVLKLTDGIQDPTTIWTFRLYTGPDGFDSGVLLETQTTPPALLNFATDLDPDSTYTLCEEGVPAGWTTEWMVDTDGDGTADTVILPYDPNEDDAIPEDLGNRCVDFGAGTPYPIPAGGTLVFQVDNRAPGGEARTPGYWKNWSTCTGGNQVQTAANNGGPAAGFWLLDDLLPQSVGDLVLTECADAVAILDSRDLDSNKKRAGDAAYTLARALLAAKLNIDAGAAHSPAVDQAILDADALLSSIGFDGTGEFLGPKSKGPDAVLRQQALALAGFLDLYNNNLLP